MAYHGEVAALGTAACWTASSLCFASAGRRVGSLPVNIIRLALALLFLSAITAAWQGQVFPWSAGGDLWLRLGLSGLVGFFIGDLCLFRALVLLGPRLSMLIMGLWPVMAAAVGWVFLGQELSSGKVAGMAVTLAGVAWATAERSDRPAGLDAAMAAAHGAGQRLGIGLALLGALGQAVGYVLAQPAMSRCDALAATQMRSVAGLAAFAVLFTALGRWRRAALAARQPDAMLLTATGALFGPCLGVALSLWAVKHISLGVAATLQSVTPILMLPVAWHQGERISWRAVAGTFIAVGGVALLFLNS